ncbi:HAD family hydrolase [Nonomuraea sp. bgisy101]|uniref:HAD family hydrolase n=1 Tax=Nonomuraea sp. bgisy101 TaxID=3413784 RepID=UPI003D73D87F
MGKARYLLIDFDGPICNIFAGLPAPQVAASLRTMLEDQGISLPESIHQIDDPLEIFRYSATLGDDLNRKTLQALTDLEVEATATSLATPGTLDLLHQARVQGKPVAVVSNNSNAAVMAYLDRHELTGMFAYVSARMSPDPSLMKPSSHLLSQALTHLEADPALSLLVGDSLTDIEASHAAGVVAVGYANRPGKAERLAASGADLIIDSMAELVL